MPTNCGRMTDRRDQILVGIFRERAVDGEIVLLVSLWSKAEESFSLLSKTALSSSALIFSTDFNKFLSMKGPFFKDLIFFMLVAPLTSVCSPVGLSSIGDPAELDRHRRIGYAKRQRP